MIPIYVSWTHFTSTASGHAVKFVTCENCPTEYAYLPDREVSGGGTTMYGMDEEGARSGARSAANATLAAVLKNDYDPVPCPACGHYQRYMFPKLLESQGAKGVALTVALLMGG